MQILILIFLFFIFLIVLGVSMQTILMIGLWIVEFFLFLCALFFACSLVALLLGKRRQARFLELRRSSGKILYAVYEMDGKKYRNLFPTDGLFKNVFYKQEVSSVKFLKTKNGGFIFDACTMLIIGIGAPVFLGASTLLGIFLVLL